MNLTLYINVMHPYQAPSLHYSDDHISTGRVCAQLASFLFGLIKHQLKRYLTVSLEDKRL